MFQVDEKKAQEITSSFQIPIKPAVLTKLQDAMAEEEPDIGKLANIISQDVALSAAILKIINSPFYGMNRVISEIKQAVMMLGISTINSLASALLLKSAIIGDACISLERFWDDALDVANAMTYMGSKVKNQIPVDMLYTIGLFQNCGIPIMAIKYADYKDTLMRANRENVDSTKLEESNYNTNHAVIGYYVATSWHLPKSICQIILRHHDQSFFAEQSNSDEHLVFAVMKAAENMVEENKRLNSIPEWDDICDEVWSTLGISDVDYADLKDDFSDMLN